MKKALIVSTVAATIGLFNGANIEVLKSLGYEVTVATHFVEGGNWSFDKAQRYKHALVEDGVEAIDISFSRSPFSISNINAFRQIKKLITNGSYSIVHCQTPIAAAITRVACRKPRKSGLRVFYTAHGFHFYKGAPIQNWLIYFPIEWLCSFWTDTLITINHEDYNCAHKHLHAKQTAYVPGVGINVQRFQNTVVDRATKLQEIGIPADYMLLLSVGELNKNKNHEMVIRTLAEVQRPDIHYVIAGKGPLEEHLTVIAKKLGVADRVHILGFRPDVAELYKAADVFVHPSFREGLPVAVMEAMASGLPCVVSKIRGNVDLINEHDGNLFSPHSVATCKESLEKTLYDSIAAKSMGNYNMEKVRQFSSEKVITQMQELYSS